MEIGQVFSRLNSKFEARNSKQIRMFKIQMTKITPPPLMGGGLGVGGQVTFRISDFEFRI